MNDTLEKLIFALIGVGTAFLLMSLVEAHPPCDDYTPPPRQQCGYESHVNPITGKLESVYVCH